LAGEYPFYSPYLFGGNDVIAASDVDGLEASYKKADGTYAFARDGNLQRPLRELDLKAYSLRPKPAENKFNDNLAKEASETFMMLTPFDELNTLITGEDVNGKEVSSVEAIFNLGMATTRSKGGVPAQSPKMLKPSASTLKVQVPRSQLETASFASRSVGTKNIIPISMTQIAVQSQGYKSVLRTQVKAQLEKLYGKDLIEGAGSYTVKYTDGTYYHGQGNVEEGIIRAYMKSNSDFVTEFEWTPSKDRIQGFKDEAKRMDRQDGGYKSPQNRNNRDSPGNRKYKKN
jgi:hypothetical protein